MSTLLLILSCPLLVVANLLMMELGARHRRRSLAAADPASEVAVSPVTATVLSLMSLVLAFSFSNAASRLDAARNTILAEVNSLETAWQRIHLAEPEGQPRLRALLRDYADARIRAYQVLSDDDAEYRRQVAIAPARARSGVGPRRCAHVAHAQPYVAAQRSERGGRCCGRAHAVAPHASAGLRVRVPVRNRPESARC